jgi:hypothetical protein
MNPMLSLEDKAILAEKHAKKKSDAQKRGISILLRDIMAHKVAPLIKKRHTFGRLHIQTIFDEPVSLQAGYVLCILTRFFTGRMCNIPRLYPKSGSFTRVFFPPAYQYLTVSGWRARAEGLSDVDLLSSALTG